MKKLYALSVSLLLAACAPQTPPSTSAKPTAFYPPLISSEKPPMLSRGAISPDTPSLKIALLIPLSGESSAIGNALLDAATMALYDSYVSMPSDRIRTHLVIIPKDTGNSTADTIKAANQAIEQGATFIIGPLFSQSVTALKPVLKEKNITMLSFSNNKAVADANAYTFGFLPEQQVERIAEFAYLNKLQRVAVLAPNDAYGEKVRDALSEIYTKKGGQAAPAELYAPSQANIDAAAARIAGAYNNTPEDRRFQAIFIADGGMQTRNILKALRKNNINPKKIKLLGTGIWDDEELTKIPEMEGAWFPSSPPDIYRVFEKRFITTYGYKPARLAGLAYDAVTIAARIAMDGKGISTSDLTDPKGFSTPADGMVRLDRSGKSDRKLAIMEVTPQGFKVIDRPGSSFVEQ